MAILKIARMGHPVLRQRAEPVSDPAAPEVAALVADMVETMIDAEGMGLAAPQVHVSRRIVVFRAPRGAEEDRGERAEEAEQEEDADAADGWGLTVLINPQVEPIGEEREDGWEGCLSVPGLRGLVPRYRRVRYHGVAPDGSAIARTVEGMHARVVQHECDHLDGILYPMRMADLSQLIFESEFRHLRAAEDERKDRVA